MVVALKDFTLNGVEVKVGEPVQWGGLPAHRRKVLERLRYVKVEADPAEPDMPQSRRKGK